MYKNFDEIITRVLDFKKKKILAIVNALDSASISAAIIAKEKGIVEPLLFGDFEKIKDEFSKYNISDFTDYKVVNAKTDKEAAQLAVEYVKEKKADILMKGYISTATFLKAVLDPDNGLRKGKNLLSDVFVFEDKIRDKLVMMSDGGVNIYPTLNEKVEIIKNAVIVAHALGVAIPKVALLAAVEVVNPKMPPTEDAAIISQMNSRGQIKNCLIDGPFALDNAISEKAAKIKKIDSPVAGKADILVVPNIESGNIFGKSLTLYANFEVGHVLMGASAPIIITSRSDEKNVKINSMALASIVAEHFLQ